MGPKKSSPVKDAKVAKKAPAKKATAKTPTKKAAATAKTPINKASNAKASGDRKYIKVECGGIDAKNAQDFATYTWTLYLEGSKYPIAVFEGVMPHKDDAFWCGGTGPVFGVDLEVMGKDGHRFVWNY